MKCPYCKKQLHIPNVVYLHTETYGGGPKRFKCIKCKKVVKIFATIKIVMSEPKKTNEEADW